MTIRIRSTIRLLSAVPLLALYACGNTQPPPASPARADSTPDGALEQPADPRFIGRVWVSTTPGSARGSIMVFLPDRTLLMDSCFETFRLSQWGVAGDKIRWLEDVVPIEAEVVLPGKDALRLKIAGQDRELNFVAASVPYTCPDMPR